MANFGAADVKRLRELTGAGMLNCKNALADADGDFDKAVELLRVKGAKDVGKRASRTAANGLVAAVDGAMVRLNCETDFVAKNEQFQRLGVDIVALVAGSNPSSLAELLDATLADGRTVRETVDANAATLGEKLEVAEYAKFDGSVATYLHRRDPGLPPQVGVLVEYTGADAEAARGVAMQVAAMRPRFTRREDVPADVVDGERRIAEAATKEEGKPERAVPKIVEGRVNAFFRDTVLLEQQSVTDSKKAVADVVNAAGIRVERFARFAIGEG